jgi:hypothetical protein
MKRRVPRLKSDEEAEAFLESDLSDLDFSQFKSGRLRLRQGSEIEKAVTSEIYRLFEQAMAERKQIVCTYNGRRRVVCPIILGHSQGKERALTYQLAGGSNSRELPREGGWKCLTLSDVSEVQLREGPWYSGDSHKQASRCVEIVDVDINSESPYNPKRRLQSASAAKTAHSTRKRKPASRSTST